MNKQNLLTEENALKNIVNYAMNVFPKSFINNSNEFIVEPRNNVYFGLSDVKTEFDFRCKMFEWLSRPIAYELNKYWAPKLLHGFNRLLKTNFTKSDMEIIYAELGNCVNRPLTIRFIESGYDLSVLTDSNQTGQGA